MQGRDGLEYALRVAASPSQSRIRSTAPPKWEPLAVHAKYIIMPRPLPLTDSPGRGRWHEVPEGEQGGTAQAVTERASPLKKRTFFSFFLWPDRRKSPRRQGIFLCPIVSFREKDCNAGEYEPSQAKPCGFASSPEGGAFCHLPVSTNKAPPEWNDFPRPGEDGEARKGNGWRTQ